ncbi:MAG: hypothetical protein ABI461_10115 [Polyangiaceae bacterium]
MKYRGKSRRALVLLTAATLPIAVVVACSSNETFTVADPDASTDDGSTVDASNDASTTPDVAAPTWCQIHAPTAVLCADFDEGDEHLGFARGVSKSVFTDNPSDAGAYLLAPSSDSPPSALTFTIGAAGDDAGSRGQSINFPNTSTATTYALDLDFRIDAMSADPATSVLGLGAVFFPKNNVVLSFDLALTGGTVVMQIYGASTTSPMALGPAPAIGAWTHVSMLVSFAPSQVTVTGQLAIDSPVTLATANPFVSGAPTLPSVFLGLSSEGKTGPAGVSYDNLAFSTPTPSVDAGDGG